MELPQRFITCHKCPHKRNSPNGIICGQSGQSVNVHAEGNSCPVGNYEAAVALTAQTSPEEVERFINERYRLPNGWQKLSNVQDTYLKMFERAKATTSHYRSTGNGKGIVIVASAKYMASCYVTVRMIRDSGCELPIEVWYSANMDGITDFHKATLNDYDVTWKNADGVSANFTNHVFLDRLDARPITHGWQLKPFAVLHSSFDEVLYLDADSYPIRDPSYLFEDREYRRYGAIFWPDPFDRALLPSVWALFGMGDKMARRTLVPFETGQIVIDKRRNYDRLRLTLWICLHSDYYWSDVSGPKHRVRISIKGIGQKTGQGIYGDKDCWQIAWVALPNRNRYGGYWEGYGTYRDDDYYGEHPRSYAMPWMPWRSEPPAIIQHDLDGLPLFVHRVRGKFSTAAQNVFTTTPQSGATGDNLPKEPTARRFFADYKGLEDAEKAKRPSDSVDPLPPLPCSGCRRKAGLTDKAEEVNTIA